MPSSSSSYSPPVERLLERIGTAAAQSDVEAICAGVKDALCEQIVRGGLELPAELIAPAPDKYARRLLHKCPQDSYAIVIMVWGTDQSTPIHDHAGKWCVECVYSGKIKVTSYDKLEETDTTARFRAEDEIFAERGNAGALIPPRDYHVIANAQQDPSVTIHVYGGEMEGCHAFSPQEGDVYEKKWCGLSYTQCGSSSDAH